MAWTPAISPDASPEEAAAVMAAVEQFLRDHAHAPNGEPALSAWKHAALREGVNRAPDHPSFWP